MHRHLIWPNAKCHVSAESEPATSDLLHVVEDVRDHFFGELLVFVSRLLVLDLLFVLLLLALHCPLFDVAVVFVMSFSIAVCAFVFVVR